MGEITLMIIALHAVKSACNASIHFLEDWWDNETKKAKEEAENSFGKKYRR